MVNHFLSLTTQSRDIRSALPILFCQRWVTRLWSHDFVPIIEKKVTFLKKPDPWFTRYFTSLLKPRKHFLPRPVPKDEARDCAASTRCRLLGSRPMPRRARVVLLVLSLQLVQHRGRRYRMWGEINSSGGTLQRFFFFLPVMFSLVDSSQQSENIFTRLQFLF